MHPSTRTEDVADVLHGTVVADPYRWLEDASSAEVQAWQDAQNAHTEAVLHGLPRYAQLRARLDQLLTVGGVGCPVPKGSRLFFSRRRGTEDQAKLYVQDADGERVLIDPNTIDASGLVTLDWWYPSHDGKRVAYGLSRGGDEWSVLHVVDLETGRMDVAIPRTRAAAVAWLPDGSGFYYTRYPEAGTVPAGEETYHRHVFLHRLGTDWRADEVVWGPGRPREDWPSVDLSEDGRWLAVFVHQGWSRTEVYVRDLHAAGGFVPVLEGVDATATGELARGALWLQTNLDAPNGRLFRVDPANPARGAWVEILPERGHVLEQARVIAGALATVELERASSRLRLYELDGRPRAEVTLPELGTVGGLGGEPDGDAIYLQYTSFARPSSAYAASPDGVLRLIEAPELPAGLDADRYDVRQVEATSKDGTVVTMFLVHRKDVARDGRRPTVLSGYGGFSISRTPVFSASMLSFLDDGGVYAIANLRGGGEYGEQWHQAGMLGHKQNVFDDFVACAEWLVANVTKPERLAIWGGSNGGLLVGAALTQRPDLFAAVVCAVPLLDMVRYPLFQLARLWIPEYGDPAVAEHFGWLYAYSPYHRVRDGVTYPATLLLAGAGDSRVDPMHARKMAARLQASAAARPPRAEASGSPNPVLLRVEGAAGHGVGKPRGKVVDEAADCWAFVYWQLGV